MFARHELFVHDESRNRRGANVAKNIFVAKETRSLNVVVVCLLLLLLLLVLLSLLSSFPPHLMCKKTPLGGLGAIERERGLKSSGKEREKAREGVG